MVRYSSVTKLMHSTVGGNKTQYSVVNVSTTKPAQPPNIMMPNGISMLVGIAFEVCRWGCNHFRQKTKQKPELDEKG